MDKVDLLSLNPDELEQVLSELGEPKFRAKQLFGWLHKGVAPEEMRNLPAGLRTRIAENFLTNPVRILEEKVSKLDGTRKFLYALEDGNLIEGYGPETFNGRCVETVDPGLYQGAVFEGVVSAEE